MCIVFVCLCYVCVCVVCYVCCVHMCYVCVVVVVCASVCMYVPSIWIISNTWYWYTISIIQLQIYQDLLDNGEVKRAVIDQNILLDEVSHKKAMSVFNVCTYLIYIKPLDIKIFTNFMFNIYIIIGITITSQPISLPTGWSQSCCAAENRWTYP